MIEPEGERAEVGGGGRGEREGEKRKGARVCIKSFESIWRLTEIDGCLLCRRLGLGFGGGCGMAGFGEQHRRREADVKR